MSVPRAPDADDDQPEEPNKAEMRRVRLDGVFYTCAITHEGNSGIMFHPNGDTSLPPVPGVIERIQHAAGEYKFTVRRYLRADLQGAADPFSRWSYFKARLWSSVLAQDAEVIPFGGLSSHAIRYETDDNLMVVLPVSRHVSAALRS
jgi:hypothetical protein